MHSLYCMFNVIAFYQIYVFNIDIAYLHSPKQFINLDQSKGMLFFKDFNSSVATITKASSSAANTRAPPNVLATWLFKLMFGK
jgi:hypothetical protein